jgi:adenosylmethionine-8-amino-7-oxononanoate aminotransferase
MSWTAGSGSVTPTRGARPQWYDRGWPHMWLPYAQMKTATPPLAVASTQGSRIVLADRRELIDGIASWWTACHGYNHPHIRIAVMRQLEIMPHVMFGGLVHEQAMTLARRLTDLLPKGLDRVFFSDSGSVSVEVALKMACARPHAISGVQGRLSRRYDGCDVGVRSGSWHAQSVSSVIARALHCRPATGRKQHREV